MDIRKVSLARRLVVVSAALALAIPAAASAHARVSPAVSVSGKLQLYSLAVPTEKSNLTTTKIVMTVPAGFGDRLVRSASARLEAVAFADRVRQ